MRPKTIQPKQRLLRNSRLTIELPGSAGRYSTGQQRCWTSMWTPTRNKRSSMTLHRRYGTPSLHTSLQPTTLHQTTSFLWGRPQYLSHPLNPPYLHAHRRPSPGPTESLGGARISRKIHGMPSRLWPRPTLPLQARDLQAAPHLSPSGLARPPSSKTRESW